MKTKELIDILTEIIDSRDYTQDWEREYDEALNEAIKRLEELEELKQCSVKGVDGEWIHIKDIQLLTNIVKE